MSKNTPVELGREDLPPTPVHPPVVSREGDSKVTGLKNVNGGWKDQVLPTPPGEIPTDGDIDHVTCF